MPEIHFKDKEAAIYARNRLRNFYIAHQQHETAGKIHFDNVRKVVMVPDQKTLSDIIRTAELIQAKYWL